MEKNILLQEIFKLLMKNGKVTEKADILETEPMEQKVYTKKLEIGKNINDTELVYVTITSNDKHFTDTSITNMRINTKNIFNNWANIFATEANENILNTIYNAIAK